MTVRAVEAASRITHAPQAGVAGRALGRPDQTPSFPPRGAAGSPAGSPAAQPSPRTARRPNRKTTTAKRSGRPE